MPFKSEAQRRWMHANHPEMAKEWEAHTPAGKLPARVKNSQWDADTSAIIGAAPEPRTQPRLIGRLAKLSDYDDPWGGDGTKLMPYLRAIHKMGEVKLAEPPPPKGVSVKEWDKILQGKKKLAEDRPVAETEFQGLKIGVENPKGSVRSGVDKDGHEWHTKMKLPYGFIEGTKGKDGDSVDVFVGPDKNADKAYVVHQRTADGKKYDEDKVFLGLHSKKEAKEAFLMHNDNPQMLGDVAEVSMERLQQLCEEKGRLTKISQVSWLGLLDEVTKLSGVEEQLRKGQKVEEEHEGTIELIKRNPNIPNKKAERIIASDHLRELPDYYDRLHKMEAGAEKQAAPTGLIGKVLSWGPAKNLASMAAKNPATALRVAGGVGGAAVGAIGGAATADPGSRGSGALKGALLGGGLGLGAGHLAGKSKSILGATRGLGSRLTGPAAIPATAVKGTAGQMKVRTPGTPPPPAAGVAGPTPVEAGAAPKVASAKLAWSWEGFKEGLQDEGIPLSGATIGAGLGAIKKKGLTGAALGYAAGSGASILRSKLKGEEPTTARKVLALSGLGYGMGGMAHAGLGRLTKNIKPGTLRSVFHEAEHDPSKIRLLQGLAEEGIPALGATTMTGVALATDKHRGGHVTPPTERGAPIG